MANVRRGAVLALLLGLLAIVGFTAQLTGRLHESAAEPLQTSPFCAATPPKIAWCVVGGARTLSRPVVARSIRTNLFEAFGARSTVFALLKTTDNADKLDWGVRPVDSSAAELRDASRVLGVAPSHVRFVSPADEPSPNEACSIRPEWFGAAGKKRGIKTWINSHLRGTLGQLSSWHQCFEMVEKAEANTGEKFDLVAKVRPDTFWFQAVMPWCTFVNADSVHANAYWGDFLNKTGQGGGRTTSAVVDYPPDQFFMLPRALAPRVFMGLLDEYNACPTGYINAGYSIEEWAWGKAVAAAQSLNIALHRYPFPQVILRPNADAADVENKCARFVLPALPPTARSTPVSSAAAESLSQVGDTMALRLARCKEFLYQDLD